MEYPATQTEGPGLSGKTKDRTRPFSMHTCLLIAYSFLLYWHLARVHRLD